MKQALDALVSSNGALDGSLAGLETYCSAWSQACDSPSFKQAQIDILAKRYYLPAVSLALASNLRHPISVGQIYDTVVQMGYAGAQSLIADGGPLVSSSVEDEMEWMTGYMNRRVSRLKSMGDVYAATITRVTSYQYVFMNGKKDTAWDTDGLKALDNDGKVSFIPALL